MNERTQTTSAATGWRGLAWVLLGFVALQMWNFSHRWVDDESWYIMPTPSVFKGEFNIPVLPGDDRFWPQPPVLTYLVAGMEALVGTITPVLARSVSLFFGCLTIVAAFALGRRLAGAKVGIWAALFVACDNLVFLAARTVRPEMIVAFALLWALLRLLPSLEGQRWQWRHQRK